MSLTPTLHIKTLKQPKKKLNSFKYTLYKTHKNNYNRCFAQYNPTKQNRTQKDKIFSL